MKRQRHIYIAAAFCSLAVLGYVIERSVTAWDHYGPSSVFWVIFALVPLFFGLAALYVWLAFLFSWRSVGSIEKAEGGFLLIGSTHSTFQPIFSSRVQFRRNVGDQIAWDEAAPKFVLFTAANKNWVCTASTYQVVVTSEFNQ
jgi:hypothetical protein